MALSIKVDTGEVPSILKILGIGGMPAQANDTGGVSGNPPAAGSPAPQSSPSATAPSSADSSSTPKPPTKLLRLQQTLGAVAGGDYPAPDLSTAAPPPSVPPPGLASSMAADASTPRKATFAERHPGFIKLLTGATQFAQDAGPGIGARTFGEGFQTAAEQPALRQQRALAIQQGQAQLAHTKAQTQQLQTQVTLPNGPTVPLVLAQKLYPTLLTEQGKNSRNEATINSRESIAADKNALNLRRQGLKPNPDDPNGAPVPLTYEELSPSEQAHYDLLQSQQDAAQARADLDKAKNDPTSAAYKAAYGRLQVAQQNANTAVKRLGLDQEKFKADYFGTDKDGNPLPGTPTDENGNPIGPKVANAGKPSADRIRRGDLAANAIHNLNNIAEIVNRRPELFGTPGGLLTSVQDMIGSDDADIRSLGVEIHNYALASNGAHGVRSQQAIQKTEDELLRNFRAGQHGIIGGIAAAKGSLQDFVNDQQLGNRARPGATTTQPQKPAAAKGKLTPQQQRDQKLGVVYISGQRPQE